MNISIQDQTSRRDERAGQQFSQFDKPLAEPIKQKMIPNQEEL